MIGSLVCLDKIMNAPAAAVLSELELLRSIVNASVDLNSVVGPDYKFLYANPAYLKYFSKEPADIIGHTVSELIGESIFCERSKPLLDRTLKGESVSYFARFDFPGVGMRDAEVFYNPARNRLGEVVGVVAVIRDVEDLERTRSALLSSQRVNRVTFDHAAVGIAHVGLNGAWLEVNPRLCEIVGYTKEKLKTLTFQDITHADDLEADLEHVRELIDGEKQAYSMEKRYIRAGGDIIWIELTVSLVRDADGKPLHFIKFVQDIHARKIAERELIESKRVLAEAVQEISDRAVSLERFVHVLSHDLREPLNTIANFTGLLASEDSIGKGTAGGKYLGYVQAGTARMKLLLDDLLRYVRLDRPDGQFVTFSLAQVAEEVRSDLVSQIDRAGAQITINSLPEMTGEPNLIRLVLQNLVSNAIKFVDPETRPLITIRDDSAPASDFRISVCDNGIGIEASALPALFTPFSRLHVRRRYAGTGLGLAICKRIVDLHGGRIEVASTPGLGSCFTLILPRHLAAGDSA